MQSSHKINKKRRQLSQELITIQLNPPKHQNLLEFQPTKKYIKLDQLKSSYRKSMELQRVSKCEDNFDFLKRGTDWNRTQIDTVEFQKIVVKREKKNRLKFKTINVQSIQHRNRNSIVEANQISGRKNVALDYQLKNQRKFNLEKESLEFLGLQTEIKQLHDREVEEKAKNKILSQLNALINFEMQRHEVDQERNILLSQSYSKAVRKQQQKTDFLIKLMNDIKDKIINYKKEIYSNRSQRVIYSSIFKSLQSELKLTENLYKEVLINSITRANNIEFSNLENLNNFSMEFEQSQSSTNSYSQYSNMFHMFDRTNRVEFNEHINFNQEQILHDKINSNTALNYYTQSRKVIILPRYKEHYQSLRKKIIFQKQTRSYEELYNQIKRFFHALEGLGDQFPQFVNHSDETNPKNSFKNTFYNGTADIFMYAKNILCRQNILNQVTGSNFPRHSCNFELLTKNEIEKIKKLMKEIPINNQILFKQIAQFDILIDEILQKIQEEKYKNKLFQTSQSSKVFLINHFFEKDANQNQRTESFIQEKQLRKIKDLLQIEPQNCSKNSIMSALQKLDEFYIATKTVCIFGQDPVSDLVHKTFFENDFDKDRSNMSLRFKKVDQNIPPSNKIVPDQKSLFIRGPQTLDSIFKNIQVYELYERAFERIDFQKQYQAEKNRKKRTLIRGQGMVSLKHLKKQTFQQNKFMKRQSSDKKNQFTHR